MLKDIIHTINSRDHILFELLRQDSVTDSDIEQSVFSSFEKTRNVLKEKGVKYNNLKSALVPNNKKSEICLFFDAHKTRNSTIYGVEIMDKFLPFLKLINTCSVFHGDYVFWNKHSSENIYELEQKMIYSNHSDLRMTRVFCIYVNNVDDNFIKKINKSLSKYVAYIGYVDVTRTSKLKWLLSSMLGSFIKHNDYIIMGHEEDRSNDENVNMSIYPLEKNGFKIRSIQNILFNIFLSYKIERPVLSGFELDEEISLLVLCGISDSTENYNFYIKDDKFEYLKNAHGVNLKNAQIDSLDNDELTSLIKDNIRKNYIFNFKEAPDGAKCFGTIIEVPRKGKDNYRLTVGMKINTNDKIVEVTTVY